MGQSTKSTRSEPPHTGRPLGRVNMAELEHDSHLHGRVPTEPKLSPIRKRPLLKASRYSKHYKYTLEEDKKGDKEGGVRNYSKEAD
ncbi:Protein F12 [Gossypium arboreum]|uniref:Protein F12 n=1 Tax=Gossypium arboreum TaxID=29729 RepID=A0A0B0MHG3_GOSAR|nr:Protein F12 [Gossypium arboreum]